MVTDSLRYWVQEMHVDGFRFDLGTILAREPNGFDNRSGFLKACSQDPVLGGVKMIAEPWDCGPGGYQVGEFPPGWAEWNDKYRDTVRDFWRGEASAAAVSPRLYGSADIFDRFGRRPHASINFITSHDGFTLNDLVSYNERHNEANGENNADGHSHNRSWNCGAEGPTDDEGVNALRQRQMRNMLATLLLSQGTPMLLAGDEFARTQRGNNNAYCQDNDISWVDWSQAERNRSLVEFVQQLTGLRSKYPILRRNRFLSAQENERIGLKEITWVNATGKEMTDEEWRDEAMRCFGMLLDGRAQTTGIRQRGQDATILIVLNAYHDLVNFTLPGEAGEARWLLLADTNIARPSADAGKTSFESTDGYGVTGRSLVIFRLDAASDSAIDRSKPARSSQQAPK
jgi:isoamylase